MTSLLCALSLSCLALAGAGNAPSQILIRGGLVVDGSGRAPFRADVRVRGERILEVGRLRQIKGERVVGATGLIVAPGFIDAHSHADANVSEHPLLESQVRQGITTAVVGQDGGGKSPIRDLFRALKAARAAINFAAFAGHGSIRRRVLGEDFARPATPREIEEMKLWLEDDMAAGALGLSSGLEYDPGSYANLDELIALAKILRPFGGSYISHVRDEGNGALSAFRELIRIAETAGIPAQISHIKLGTASVWGRSAQVVAMLDAARARGVDVRADVYPYLYWQSTITVLTLEKDWESLDVWRRALQDVGGAANVLLSEYSPNRAWVGKSIELIAKQAGRPPEWVVREIVRRTHGPLGKGSESVVVTAMEEGDLEAFLKWPWTMICSDGRHLGSHPRGAGAFPRVVARYVRLRKLFSLQEAVRKMTSLPASSFGLRGRGRVERGAIADLVVFDSGSLADSATPSQPTLLSKGVVHVLVNGTPVLIDGKFTGSRPGVVLSRDPGSAAAGRNSHFDDGKAFLGDDLAIAGNVQAVQPRLLKPNRPHSDSDLHLQRAEFRVARHGRRRALKG